MPISTISQAGLNAPLSLTSPTLTTPNIDSAQIPTVSGTAPLYMCRAWVNFNGTTASPSTIRGSGNVTSVTKSGTGNYTVNFTTAMTDANFCAQVTGGDSFTGAGNQTSSVYSEAYTTTTIQVRTFGVVSGSNTALSARDFNFVNVSVFR